MLPGKHIILADHDAAPTSLSEVQDPRGLVHRLYTVAPDPEPLINT